MTDTSSQQYLFTAFAGVCLILALIYNFRAAGSRPGWLQARRESASLALFGLVGLSLLLGAGFGEKVVSILIVFMALAAPLAATSLLLHPPDFLKWKKKADPWVVRLTTFGTVCISVFSLFVYKPR